MKITREPRFRRQFLDYISRHRPVDATFIGLHENDHCLPDLSESGLADRLSTLERLEVSLQAIAPARLSPLERLDRELILGQVAIERWELRTGRFWQTNPSYYTGEAIFGVLSLFLSPFAPFSERAERACARLARLPAFLEQARLNLRNCPPSWIERALRECTGATKFLEEGVPLLAAKPGPLGDSLLDAAQKARQAFHDLEEDLVSRNAEPTAGYSYGAEGLDLLLRRGHFLDRLSFDADAIEAYAREELLRARSRFDQGLKELGFPSREHFLAHLSSLHPDPQDYLSRFDELCAQVRKTVQEQDLLSWPDFPIRFVPRPAWARSAAPFLYFLYYRSPAAFGAPTPHLYLVEPIEDLPESQQQRVLRTHNQSAIKLNHVIHHGSIGHHVQNWHASRSPSLIGRIAAIDCASRIALLCGGTMAEGWACYTTGLMREVGLLTPEEELAELHGRLRMCARASVDVGIHRSHMSLDQAKEFYQAEAGMTAAAASNEVVKNSLFPATALMYLMGTDAIHRLRREVSERWGSDFSLRRFHDTFLSYGSIPVTLIREAMLAGEDRP